MGIFKLILFVIHFQLAYSNIFSHFAKKFESISPETIEITNLKNMFACFPENSENCARVIQLQILANASFNCYLEVGCNSIFTFFKKIIYFFCKRISM